MLVRLLTVLPALALSACVLSLEPLYGDADLTFDPALVGTWKPVDEPESWKCRKSEDGAYRVVYTDERGRKGEFSVHLLSIDGKRFLDLFPVETATTRNPFYSDHWIPAHTFARVLSMTPALKLAIFDQDWLEKLLAKQPEALAHKIVGGHVVITAATDEVKHFLSTHADTPGAFRASAELRKAS